MDIYLLARSRKSYSTRRLLETAGALGVRLSVVDPLKCTLLLSMDSHRIFYEAVPMRQPQAVLARLGQTTRDYGLAVVEQFEMMGVPVVDSSSSTAVCADSTRALQTLAAAGEKEQAASLMLRSEADGNLAVVTAQAEAERTKADAAAERLHQLKQANP